MHKVSKCCSGVTCHVCNMNPASHKVGEEIFEDAEPILKGSDGKVFGPVPRHNLTAYTCCACFVHIMGPYMTKACQEKLR